MKRILSTSFAVLMACSTLWAQQNPNDMNITGYVLNSNGGAVSGQQVCVTWGSFLVDSLCTYTNSNGWYSLYITDGSVVGPNVTYNVITSEMCNGAVNTLTATASNQQGTVDTATVIFNWTCNPNGGGCNCVADITSTMAPDSMTYTFASSVSGNNCTGPFSYVWWMPDGSSATGASSSYTFTSDGTYGVCVTVTDASGCASTNCDTIVIGNGGTSNCDASFWYSGANPNGGAMAGENTSFYYNGANGAFNDLHFYWTAQGNGLAMTSSLENPVFTFPSAGQYTVCLQLIDSTLMCSDSYCTTFMVSDSSTSGCQAYFTLNDSTGYVAFYDQSQGNPTQWFWDFGDGSTSTVQYPYHVYSIPGTYTICLTSSNSACSDTYCTSVSIGTNSDCGFTYSGGGPAGGNTVTFVANQQNIMAQYVWQLSNGVVLTGSSVSYTFTTEGSYDVCLTTYSNVIDTCTSCQMVTIGGTCTSYLTGQIFAGNTSTPIDYATAYLITFDSGTNMLTAVQTVQVDSLGYFWFSAPCGDYLVKAAASSNSAYYADHLPTYYGNSPFWNFADEITIAEGMPSNLLEITLISGSNNGGPGFIGGDVTEGANKQDPGDAIAGVAVEVFDMSGNAILYTYTDANGEFSLSDLAYGTYQVYVEVLGVPCTPAIVTLSATNPSVTGLSFYVNTDLIATGINTVTNVEVLGTYPNPATDRLTIGLNAKDAMLMTVTVSDLTGRTVSSHSQSVASGSSTLNLNVSQLVPGMYLLNIGNADGNLHTERFMKAD